MLSNISHPSMRALLATAFLSLAAQAIVQSQPLQQHVVLVIIDGARYSETLGDPTAQYTPRMHGLATVGAVVDTFLNDSLTYTQRAIPAIWCGTWVPPVDTTIGGIATQYARVPTLWEYFRKDLNRDSTDALYELKMLTAPWLPSFHPQYGPRYWPWYDMQDWSDLYVWQNARARLTAFHPTLTVLYLADVDHAGHLGVWQDYTRAIAIADSIVGMLWDFVQGDPIYRNTTTVFVTNDHGRHSDGTGTGFVGHGDGCPGCRRIELLSIGSGVQHIRSNVRRRIPDLTPTIGALLGYSSPFSTGSVMTELLKPVITFAPDTIDFGEVPVFQTGTDSVMVWNSGGVDLNLTLIPGPGFGVDPTAGVVPPRQWRGFRITFTPVGEDSVTGVIRLLHNDGGRVDSVVVRGRGGAGTTVDVSLSANWNLVSLPVTAADPRTVAIFPDAISPAFAFLPGVGYVPRDSLSNGLGYWIKYPAEQTVGIAGRARWTDTVVVSAGWNLVGTCTVSILADSILQQPPGLLSSDFFSYAGTYTSADTLTPGRGYWVKAAGNGWIVLR
jgi:hypothetical protein